MSEVLFWYFVAVNAISATRDSALIDKPRGPYTRSEAVAAVISAATFITLLTIYGAHR